MTDTVDTVDTKGDTPRNTNYNGGCGSSRARGWSLTFNTFTQDTIQNLKTLSEKNVKFVVFQSEVGDRNGHRHLQCYLYFNNARSFQSMLKMFPEKPHIEISKKNSTVNINYCTKRDTWDEKVRYKKIGSKIHIDIDNESNCNSIVENPKLTFEERRKRWINKSCDELSNDIEMLYWFRKIHPHIKLMSNPYV